MAAVLSAGDDSALSHLAGAAHLGLVRLRPSVTDVTCHRALRPRTPIRFHRSRLAPDEVMVHDGIPVTTVSRTLLDLGGILSSARLALAINEAEVQRLTSHLSLPELLDRHPRRPGAGVDRIWPVIGLWPLRVIGRCEPGGTTSLVNAAGSWVTCGGSWD
jgi:hypothetical protein